MIQVSLLSQPFSVQRILQPVPTTPLQVATPPQLVLVPMSLQLLVLVALSRQTP